METSFLLLHVAALLDLADDGGIRAGPADPFLLQALYQRRLAITRRRLREVLRVRQVQQIEQLLLLESRQQRIFLLAARRQHTAVAVKLEDLALGLEDAVGGRYLHVGDGKD